MNRSLCVVMLEACVKHSTLVCPWKLGAQQGCCAVCWGEGRVLLGHTAVLQAQGAETGLAAPPRASAGDIPPRSSFPGPQATDGTLRPGSIPHGEARI